MGRDLQAFNAALDREEAVFAAEVASDRSGILLRVAVNELDLLTEGTGHSTEAFDEERLHLTRLGALRAVKLSLDAHPRFDKPTVTLRRDPYFTKPVLSVVQGLGIIEHGRRIARSVAMGAGQLAETGADRFAVTLPSRISDPGFHERRLDQVYRNQSRGVFHDVHAAVFDSKFTNKVRKLIRRHVRPFMDHFISYDTEPEIDSYFFAIAYHELMLSPGFDTFHYTTRFGGQPFRNYQLAAAFIVSIAMKHRAFVAALLKKSPGIRLEDILTVSAETAGFLDDMRRFLDEYGSDLEGHEPPTDEGVRIIFDVLSVGRHNSALLAKSGGAIPPLLQCSDEHVIKPLAGAGLQIMQFLLESLRLAFPSEYDRAQRDREAAMQAAAKRVLSSALPNLSFRDNVRLRREGRTLTDVDLVVTGALSDGIILVQLKHQDPFGDDLAAMRSRTERLNKQVADWLSSVDAWLASSSPMELRSTFRLPTEVPVEKVVRMVLTRHFAYPLREVAGTGGAIFSNWNGLVAAVEQLAAVEVSKRSLAALVTILQEAAGRDGEDYAEEPPSEWRVGKLEFSIVIDENPGADPLTSAPA